MPLPKERYVEIAEGKVGGTDGKKWLYGEYLCDIDKDWIFHPRPLYTLTQNEKGELVFPKIPKYQYVCLGGGANGKLITKSELPWKRGLITYYGCISCDSFITVRGLRGTVTTRDTLTGEEVKFKTEKYAMLSIFTDKGEDTAVFDGTMWRPIGYFDKEDVTLFMDDPELRPDCKYVYGERKKGV